MVPRTFISWIYHFWARFWPNFNVVDFTWQFLIRTFLRVSAFPYPEKLLLQIIVHCSSCTGEYSFSNRYLTYPFSMFLLKKNRCFPSQIFFSCPCSKCYPAKFSFFLSSNPFLVFTVFDSLFLFLSLLCLCRRMKSGYNEGLWCLRVSDRVI